MVQIIGVLVCLIAAIFVGQDAKSKGMDAWGWGIFVFLLLIIGLPAYLVVRKLKVETRFHTKNGATLKSQTSKKNIKIIKMKVISIIGIAWFSVSLICMFGCYPDMGASASWGLLGLLYALPYAIVGLIKSANTNKKGINTHEELLKFNELKEKGILSDDEFQAKKLEILNK